MKKYILFLFILCLQLVPSKAQWVTIPDANFVTKLTQLYPSCMNGNQLDTTCTQFINEDSLTIENLPIINFEGIQYFDSLKFLRLFHTNTTSFPTLPNHLDRLEWVSMSLPNLPQLPNSLKTLICTNNNNTYPLTSLPTLPSGLKVLVCTNNNQITSLPALPNSIEYLRCNKNELSALPVLPNSLVTLYCDDNNINDLPILPNTLQILSCSKNYLVTLPTLPNSLIKLNCYQTGLSILPTLPNLLDSLICSYNNLTSLPFLPNSLKRLNCYNNQLTSLPVLPDSLLLLDCGGNTLASFPQWPASLISLACNSCQLTSLPPLPINLISFYCYWNQLTSLPTLPMSLKYLYCNNNSLSNLPVLNDSLHTLDCSNNQLTSLPTLPNSLIVLICNNNQLTLLPPLPNMLFQLECGNNQITSLPVIPGSLIRLYCAYNQLTFIPAVPSTMWVYDIRYNNINCVTNLPYVSNHNLPWAQISNTLLTCVPNQTNYSLGLPLCIDNDPINNPSNCASNVNISGFVFTDEDSNCAYSAGDLGSINIPVKLYDSLNNLVAQYYTSGGSYGFSINQPGVYKVKIPSANLPYSVGCSLSDSLFVNLVSINNSVNNNNFPIFCNEGFDSYTQSVTNQGWVFPAQIHTLQTNITNNEAWYNIICDSLNYSGTVTIELNGPVSYVSPYFNALTPQVNGNTFTYSISDFSSITPNSFGLRLITDTFAQAGSPVCAHISIATNPVDADTINNEYTHCYNVVNSYDPNMKEVYPQNLIPGYNDWFTYTIHFQNTGNAPAFDILLKDSLDPNLDISSFEVLAYSHTPNVTLYGNLLSVRFNNIMLPDSTSDYEGSMGYFQYRIKPLPNLPVGTQISNIANIYFDYNPPIVTNTAQSNFNCQPISAQQTLDLCQGESLQVGNILHTTGGIFIDVIPNATGCDSVVTSTINLLTTDTSLVLSGDTLFATSSYLQYEWINCDNDSIVQSSTNHILILPFEGSFKVKITNSNGCEAYSNCITFNNCQQISSQQSFTICNGDSLQVGNNWYNNSGTYTDSLLTLSGCDSIITTIINQSIIETSLLISNDTVIAQPNYNNYEWIDCDNNQTLQISTNNHFIIPYAGNFKVKITNNDGCSTFSMCIPVSIICVQINAQQSINLCNGDSLQVGNNWYAIGGTYTDSLFTPNGCDSIVTTTINQSIIDTTLLLNFDSIIASPNYSNYEWIDCNNGQSLQSSSNQIFVPINNGSYGVIITDNTGCIMESSCLQVVVTALDENMSDEGLNLSPNPAQQELVISIQYSDIKQCTILDALGQTVYNSVNQSNAIHKIQLNISTLSSGVYFVKVSTSNGYYTAKFIKSE